MTLYPDITLKQDRTEGAKSNWYQVREDCEYVGLNIIIPEGFSTDFSSVPRFLWPIFPPHGAAASASVVHDYMYTARPLQPRFSVGPKARLGIERYIADKVFEENLIAIGIKKWQAKLMYWAVRLFGASRFRKQTEDEK